MALEAFFSGQEDAGQIFEAVRSAVDSTGPMAMRVSKSQVSFRIRGTFAAVWMPHQYLAGHYQHRQLAPLVLTIYLRRRDASPRWKQVVEPYPGRFTHHLELYSPADIDEEVCGWLREARATAGD